MSAASTLPPAPVAARKPAAARAHLPALTGLRFFLALWVIVNHLVGKGHIYEPIAAAMPGPLSPIFRTGYMAVPTFFVLSGFVLARTYGQMSWTPRNLWKYLVGRVARVYPVYLLSLLIVVPFIIKAKDQPKGWLVAMHLTLTQGWFTGHYTAGWNTPAWSLSCEMFFYLMFPLLIVPMRNAGWVKTAAAAIFACALAFLMPLAGVPDNLKPLTHLADFLLGIAVCRALDMLTADGKTPSGRWLYCIGFLGSGAAIGYAQFLPAQLPLGSVLRPLNAVLLLGLGLGGGWVARILSNRVLVYLGKASYGMYILHIPVLWWAVSWPDFAVRYLYVAGIIVGSCIIYSTFEEPANRSIRALASKPKAA